MSYGTSVPQNFSSQTNFGMPQNFSETFYDARALKFAVDVAVPSDDEGALSLSDLGSASTVRTSVGSSTSVDHSMTESVGGSSSKSLDLEVSESSRTVSRLPYAEVKSLPTTLNALIPPEVRDFWAASDQTAFLEKLGKDEATPFRAQICDLKLDLMMAKDELGAVKAASATQKAALEETQANLTQAVRSLAESKAEVFKLTVETDAMSVQIKTTLVTLDQMVKEDPRLADTVDTLKKALQSSVPDVAGNPSKDALTAAVGNLTAQLNKAKRDLDRMADNYTDSILKVKRELQLEKDLLRKKHSEDMQRKEAEHKAALAEQEVKLKAEAEAALKANTEEFIKEMQIANDQTMDLHGRVCSCDQVVSKRSIFGKVKRWFKKFFKRSKEVEGPVRIKTKTDCSTHDFGTLDPILMEKAEWL